MLEILSNQVLLGSLISAAALIAVVCAFVTYFVLSKDEDINSGENEEFECEAFLEDEEEFLEAEVEVLIDEIQSEKEKVDLIVSKFYASRKLKEEKPQEQKTKQTAKIEEKTTKIDNTTAQTETYHEVATVELEPVPAEVYDENAAVQNFVTENIENETATTDGFEIKDAEIFDKATLTAEETETATAEGIEIEEVVAEEIFDTATLSAEEIKSDTENQIEETALYEKEKLTDILLENKSDSLIEDKHQKNEIETEIAKHRLDTQAVKTIEEKPTATKKEKVTTAKTAIPKATATKTATTKATAKTEPSNNTATAKTTAKTTDAKAATSKVSTAKSTTTKTASEKTSSAATSKTAAAKSASEKGANATADKETKKTTAPAKANTTKTTGTAKSSTAKSAAMTSKTTTAKTAATATSKTTTAKTAANKTAATKSAALKTKSTLTENEQKAVKVPKTPLTDEEKRAKISGKYVIKEVAYEDYKFQLFDNKGKHLFDSVSYSTKEICEKNIGYFQKNVKSGTFEIVSSSASTHYFLLKRGIVEYAGVVQKTKLQAENCIEAVKQFADTDVLIFES